MLDHVQQVGVQLDGTGQVTLGRCKVSLCFLLLVVASLLHLVELVLEVKNDLGWARNLKRIKVDDVTESKHLAFTVLSDLFVKRLLVLHNLLLLFLAVVVGFDLLFP